MVKIIKAKYKGKEKDIFDDKTEYIIRHSSTIGDVYIETYDGKVTMKYESMYNFYQDWNITNAHVGCYICGGVTNNPNFKQDFSKASQEASELGFYPQNPLLMGTSWSLSWTDNMKLAIIGFLSKCDFIYVQKNYVDSEGAKIEVKLAQDLKIPIIWQ